LRWICVCLKDASAGAYWKNRAGGWNVVDNAQGHARWGNYFLPASQHYFILLRETTINLELLSMKLNLNLKDTQGLVNQQILTKEEPSLIGSASLDDVTQGMQTCLAKVIGPIANIVFQDAVHQWKQHTSTDLNDFTLLKKTVLSQIDDPDRKQIFEKLVRDYFKNN
jgi:hypothetical protein